MRMRLAVALTVVLAAGAAFAAQEGVTFLRSQEAYVLVEGVPGERVRVTVNVPGKKRLTLTLKPLPEGMVLSNERGRQNPNDAILVRDMRAIRIEDEAR